MTYNHLVNNIPNTPINRAIITQLNRMMTASNSQWRLRIRYRTPKTPAGRHAKSFFGYIVQKGSVNRDDAKTFAVYCEYQDPQAEHEKLDERNQRWYRMGYDAALRENNTRAE